jgi:hypothetical protein
MVSRQDLDLHHHPDLHGRGPRVIHAGVVHGLVLASRQQKMMTPYEEAQGVYQKEVCARDFRTDLHLHLIHGYVFSTPEGFIMGRPVYRGGRYEEITNPAFRFPLPDAWLVYLAAGDGLRVFFQYEPYELPWIGWERNNKLRFYRTEQIKRRILQ